MHAHPQRSVGLAGQSGSVPAPSQYLAFSLGQENLAIEILSVREIIEHRPLTRVPTMPHWISGIINVRGAAVPVIDLALRLGRPPSPLTRRTCFVLVDSVSNGKHRNVGLLVDSVKSVLEIAPRDIEPVPEFGVRINPVFLSGIGKVDGYFVKLLNVDAIIGEGGSPMPIAT